MSQVSWGSIGADAHEVSAIVRWSGDQDSEYSGLFSSFKKAFKSVAKVAKGVTKVAKSIKPFVTTVAGGAALVFPPAAPVALGVAAAVNVTAAADKHVPKVSRKRKVKARKVVAKAQTSPKVRAAVVRTYHKAVAGNPKSQRAIATLVATKQAERRAKALALVKHTVRLAKAGDPGAKKAVKYLRVVRASRKRAEEQGRKVAFIVDRHGFVHRVM